MSRQAQHRIDTPEGALDACRGDGRRRLVVLAGAPEWTAGLAARLAPEGPDQPWIDDAQPAPTTLLGRDLSAVVMDAHRRLEPDRFGAAAGAIRGGGVLLLRTPPRAELERRSRFDRRFLEAVDGDPDAVLCVQDAALPTGKAIHAEMPRGDGSDNSMPPQDAGHARPPASPCDAPTRDQARAITATRRLIEGRARRPLVLTADRGRGKSTALGIAAARALSAVEGDILVTAPRPDAVAALMRHAADALGVAADPATLSLADGRIRFLAPDALLAELPPARALLVDEAAGLPAPMLERLLRHYGRIAFATTIHGYEGMGRGFEVRFRGVLDRVTPGWRGERLGTPIRFPADDPLERFSFHLLCLDAAPAEDPGSGHGRIIRPDAEALLADEALLRQIFGLLVVAHYRTRPADLVRMLDDPAIRTVAVLHDGRVQGCALLVVEGGLDTELASAVAAGRRRPPGHHGSGILAQRLGLPAGAHARALRIMRIAVHPRLQRRGIGRRLVAAVRQQAADEGCDLISSSFGATAELLAFWSACGLEPAWVGVRRNARSGEHAVLVLDGISEAGGRIAADARRVLAGELPEQLADTLADLDPDTAWRLLAGLATPEAAACGAEDERRCDAWIDGVMPLEAAPGALRRVLLRLARDGGRPLTGDAAVLLARCLQHHGWADVVPTLGARGREDAERRLRRALAAMRGDPPES